MKRLGISPPLLGFHTFERYQSWKVSWKPISTLSATCRFAGILFQMPIWQQFCSNTACVCYIRMTVISGNSAPSKCEILSRAKPNARTAFREDNLIREWQEHDTSIFRCTQSVHWYQCYASGSDC